MDRKRKILIVLMIAGFIFSAIARHQYQKYEQRKRERLFESLAMHRQAPPSYASNTPAATPEETIEEPREMFDSTLPEESFKLIAEHIGKDFKLMGLVITERSVRANISTDSEKVEAYEREKNKKTVSGPQPVNVIGGGGKLEDSLFKPSEVKFELIPKLAKEALEKAQLSDAKVDNVRFSYPGIRYEGESPEWTVLVRRGQGETFEWKHVRFSSNGKLKDIF
ncbi:MAG TPA: hypothetical protein VGV59_09155 [Pyrinomonadaceae bacterium]|nr:hypothetical protein [Pyrinomonadaceae bacterium]